MHRNFKTYVLVPILALLPMMAPDIAEAIPAFARANKVPCTTCHVQFPKLNEFGMKFKQNGYRMQGKRGKFVWTKDNLPLAAMTALMVQDMNMEMQMGTMAPTKTDTRVATRKELVLFSGGSLGPAASYFLDYRFEEVDVSGTTVSTAEANRTFVILNDLLSDSRLNLKAGVMDDEFLYLSEERKTTMRAYLSPVSRQHTGVELNGQWDGRLRYAAGFGNDERVDVSGVDNNLRSGYGWAAYAIAGQKVGARVYAAQAGTGASDRTHTQLDVNADLHFGPANLILAYYVQDNVDAVKNAGQNNLLAELIYEASPRWLLTGRYEWQDTDASNNDTQWVLSSSYYFLPNMSLALEYVDLQGDEQVDRGMANPSSMDMTMFMAGFHVGF